MTETLVMSRAGPKHTKAPTATSPVAAVKKNAAHFGLGKATRVERIDIEWPDGKKQTLTDVEANRFVAVKQN